MVHYEDHYSRQMQGFARGTEKQQIIASLLKGDHSYSKIQVVAKCSSKLIAKMSQELKSAYEQ